MDLVSFVSEYKEPLAIAASVLGGALTLLAAYIGRRREITIVNRTEPTAEPAAPPTPPASLPPQVLAHVADAPVAHISVAPNPPPASPSVSRATLEAKLADLCSALRDLEHGEHPLLEPVNAECRRLELLAQQQAVVLQRLIPALPSTELNRLRRSLDQQPEQNLSDLCRRILGREPADVIAYLQALQQSAQANHRLRDAIAAKSQTREQHLAEHRRQILECERELAQKSAE